MNELIQTLKELLASTIALKFKAQGYHWNVEGDDFQQYHELFGDIYEKLDGSVDPMAEWIRILGDYAPFKLSRFSELSTVPEVDVTSDPMMMAADLKANHDSAAAQFGAASIKASEIGQKGLENFLADCMTTHQKYSWQLRVSIKSEVED